jgi:hypothetical protein
VLRQVPETSSRRAPSQACRDAGEKERRPSAWAARGPHFLAAIAAGPRRERGANRVADAFGEQDAHRRRRPYQALHACKLRSVKVRQLIGLAQRGTRHQVAQPMFTMMI